MNQTLFIDNFQACCVEKPLIGQEFDSAEALQDYVEAFAKSIKQNFQKGDSHTIENSKLSQTTKDNIQNKEKLVYYDIKYTCYFGKKKSQPRGKKERQTR